MDLEKIKESLIKIADTLDRQGQSELADRLDQEVIILLSNLDLLAFKKADLEKEIQEIELMIPEDEKLILEDVLKSLQESLK